MNDDKAIMFAVHIVASKGECHTAAFKLGMSGHGCNECPWKEKNGKKKMERKNMCQPKLF